LERVRDSQTVGGSGNRMTQDLRDLSMLFVVVIVRQTQRKKI